MGHAGWKMNKSSFGENMMVLSSLSTAKWRGWNKNEMEQEDLLMKWMGEVTNGKL